MYGDKLAELSTRMASQEASDDISSEVISVIGKMFIILDVLIKYGYLEESVELIKSVESRKNADGHLFDLLNSQVIRYVYKIERMRNVFPEESLRLLENSNKAVLNIVIGSSEPDTYDREYLIQLSKTISGAESRKYYAAVVKDFGCLMNDEYVSGWAQEILTSLLRSDDTDLVFINSFNDVVIHTITGISDAKAAGEFQYKIIAKFEAYLVELNSRSPHKDIEIIKAKLIFTIGRLYTMNDDNDRGILYFKQCLEMRKVIYGYMSNEYARTLTMIALVLHDLQQRLELLEEAYEIRKAVLGENSSSTLNAAYNVATVLKETGRKHEAIKLLEHILTFERLPDYAYYAETQKKLANLYSETLSEKATDAWNNIRESCELEKNELYVLSTINYANELRNQGDYPRALHILQNLEVFVVTNEEFKDEYYATCLNDIGLNMQSIFGNKSQRAIEYLLEAAEIRLSKYPKDSENYWRAMLAKAHVNELMNGDALELLVVLEEADKFFSSSMELKNSNTYTYMQFRMIDEYFGLNKDECAWQKLENFYFQPGIQSKKIKNGYELRRARYYYYSRRFDEALNCCLASFHESENEQGERTEAGILLASIYLQKRDKTNCVDILNTLYREKRSTVNRLLYLTDAKGEIEEYIQGYRDVSSALVIVTHFFGDEVDSNIDIETVYEAVLYNKYLLFGFEKMLMRDYNRKVENNIQMLKKEQDELRQQCMELEIARPPGYNSVIQKKQHKLLAIAETLQDPVQLNDGLFGNKDRIVLDQDQMLIECYSIELSNNFMGISIKDTRGLSKSDIIEASPRQLDVIPSIELYMLFAIRSGQPIFSFSLFKSEIDIEIQRLRQAIEQKKPTISESQQLYRLLFSKIEHLLADVKHILFAPDAMLFQIPVGVLQNENAEYLVDRFAISYINSGNQLTDMIRKPVSFDKVLLIGNPDFSEEYGKNEVERIYSDLSVFRELTRNIRIPPLPFSELEVRSVSQSLNAPCYCTDQANKRNFLENTDSSIIHIATHGFDFNETPDHPLKPSGSATGLQPHRRSLLLTGLFLSGAENAFRDDSSDSFSGVLTADEITKLDFSHTDLVVLSACETGKGYYLSNEGIWGLRRSFELAGVRSVLVSLWSVNDLSTYIMMSKFYEFLTRGHSRMNALSLSQKYVKTLTKKELLASWLTADTLRFIQNANLRTGATYIDTSTTSDEKIFSHPKYWAGFVLFGTWD